MELPRILMRLVAINPVVAVQNILVANLAWVAEIKNMPLVL